MPTIAEISGRTGEREKGGEEGGELGLMEEGKRSERVREEGKEKLKCLVRWGTGEGGDREGFSTIKTKQNKKLLCGKEHM